MKKVLFYLFSIIYTVISQDCGLAIPHNYYTPEGLSTPFRIRNFMRDDCSAINKETTIFVEATVFDYETKELSVYYPILVEIPSQVKQNMTLPVFSHNSIVAIWFSSNKNSFIFMNNYINCSDGTQLTKFGYYANCNGEYFFSEIKKYLNNFNIPKLDINCPNMRSYSIVNEYQNYNTLSKYILTEDDKIAQYNEENLQTFKVKEILENNIDGNKLLTEYIYPALKCSVFTVNGLSSLALNEIQAYYWSKSSIAFINKLNPMINNDFYLVYYESNKDYENKINIYRKSINQPVNITVSEYEYCNQMLEETEIFFFNNYDNLYSFKSPNYLKANNLLTFLASRFNNAWNIMNCSHFTHIYMEPFEIEYINGIAVDVKIDKLKKYSDLFNFNLYYVILIIVLLISLFFIIIMYIKRMHKYKRDILHIEGKVKDFIDKNVKLTKCDVIEINEEIKIDIDEHYSLINKKLEEEKENQKAKLKQRLEDRKNKK